MVEIIWIAALVFGSLSVLQVVFIIVVIARQRWRGSGFLFWAWMLSCLLCLATFISGFAFMPTLHLTLGTGEGSDTLEGGLRKLNAINSQLALLQIHWLEFGSVVIITGLISVFFGCLFNCKSRNNRSDCRIEVE